MKKYLAYCFIFISLICKSQDEPRAYQMGDIVLNVNYGAPQITPAVIRTGINLFYKSRWGSDAYSFKINNSGVLNGKFEYAIHEDLGLGLATSYWNMGVDLDYTFDKAADGTNLQDHYHFAMSALAIGARGNYHFNTDKEYKYIDPYYGVTAGLTRYTYEATFRSDDPTRTIPKDTFKWRSGYLTYFSTTFGLRVYPVRFVAVNMEVGWDRGAFLFGGVVFKLHTKPPKFLLDK